VGDDEKKCSACAETIKIEALVCRYCGSAFTSKDVAAEKGLLRSRRVNRRLDLGILWALAIHTENEKLRDYLAQHTASGSDELPFTDEQMAGLLVETAFVEEMFGTVRRFAPLASQIELRESDLSDDAIEARAVALGMKYAPLSDEERAERDRLDFEAYEASQLVAAQKRDQDAKDAVRTRKSLRLFGILALVVILAGLIFIFTRPAPSGVRSPSAVSGIPTETSTSPSGAGGMSYETCKSLFQPDFESCMNRSDLESDWSRCKKTFFDNMERCTKK
jgi:hypothetical protein